MSKNMIYQRWDSEDMVIPIYMVKDGMTYNILNNIHSILLSKWIIF